MSSQKLHHAPLHFLSYHFLSVPSHFLYMCCCSAVSPHDGTVALFVARPLSSRARRNEKAARQISRRDIFTVTQHVIDLEQHID